MLEEVEVLIDTHFFDEFSKTVFVFPKKVMENQGLLIQASSRKSGGL